jgi:hypothetical protein
MMVLVSSMALQLNVSPIVLLAPDGTVGETGGKNKLVG